MGFWPDQIFCLEFMIVRMLNPSYPVEKYIGKMHFTEEMGKLDIFF